MFKPTATPPTDNQVTQDTARLSSTEKSSHLRAPAPYTTESLRANSATMAERSPVTEPQKFGAKQKSKGSSNGNDAGVADIFRPTGYIPTFEDYNSFKDDFRAEDDEDTAEQTKSPQPEQLSPQTKEAVHPQEYSNEARVYHARYAALDQAYAERRFDECREGCRELVLKPRLPQITRVQTLQMLSTLMQPATAEACLREAEIVLQGMDNEIDEVQLLTNDNQNMQADLIEWRMERGLTEDQDIDGIPYEDGEVDQEAQEETDPLPIGGMREMVIRRRSG